MAVINRYDNRLGVRGWLGGGRWGLERYAYTLHRISGLGILLYFIMHIVVTSLRAAGIYLWTEGQLFDNLVFKVGEFLVFAAFAYHACNGLRLILVELGVAVGRPFEPVYPYKTSLRVQRPLLIVMMIVAGAVLVGGGAELLAH